MAVGEHARMVVESVQDQDAVNGYVPQLAAATSPPHKSAWAMVFTNKNSSANKWWSSPGKAFWATTIATNRDTRAS